MPKMLARDVQTMLAAEKSDALAAVSAAQLSQDRADAMDYYLGDMSKDLPAADGRSKAVSTDVMDTIEGLMPSLMDIFCGSDEVVRFEPVGAEDEAGAEQETDYVNHVFMQQNPGFMVLYGFIKDALLSKVGIVKIWWDEREEEEKETYYDLADDQFAMLAQQVLQSDDSLEIVEHTVNEGEAGKTHDVTIKSTRKLAQAKCMGVPPEEFGIERGARNIKDCNYCFHEVVTKTESQLIEEGYDEQQVKALGDYTGKTDQEQLARDSVFEHATTGSSSSNTAARLVKITEHYIRMDYEGNGRACLYQVITGGDKGEVLNKDGSPSIVPFDAIPFAAACPVPITHRFFGRSIADLVMDIQRIKTALLRGSLDNLYLHNNPRVEVAESHSGPNTLDDLLVVRPGGVVRTKQPDGLKWQVVPDITGSVYPALAYMDSVREMRTGVTKQGQGIDANALQNQSATAVNQVFTASQARMKLIARILAEGVKDIFSLLHATIRKHGQEAQTVRLRNSWVQVDPRQWKNRNDMTINVGLGNGGRAEQFGQATIIANFQKELVLGGKTNIVDDKKLYNSAANLAKLAGHKNADMFFNDPEAKDPQTGQLKYPPPPPQQNPKMLELQAKQQGIQAKAQLDQQHEQNRAHVEQVQAQADAAVEQIKAQSQMAIEQHKAQMDAALQQAQHQMKMMEMGLKAHADQQKMQHAERLHQHDIEAAQLDFAAKHAAHEMKMQQANKPDKSPQ